MMFPVYTLPSDVPAGFQIKANGIRYECVYDTEAQAHEAAELKGLKEYDVVPAVK